MFITQSNRPKRLPSASGFTLIEMSIVILISSLILGAMILFATTYIKGVEEEKFSRVMAKSNESIMQFQLAYGFYPCPANPATPTSDPNYGYPDCSLPPVSGVLIGLMPQYINLAGNEINLASLTSSFDTLQTNFLDPWNNRLIYAVTQALTTPLTFDTNEGAVSIIDEHGRNTGGINNDGHYAIVSRGKDTTCPATGSEAENCDNDNVFISSIRYEATGNLHYDDRIAFYVKRETPLWSEHTDGAGTARGDAKNDNTGNIGIRVTTPQEKVDVGGKVEVSDRARFTELCENADTASPLCMEVTSLYDLRCPNYGDYLKGVTMGAGNRLSPVCAPLEFTTLSNVNCNTKGGVQYIRTNGEVRCNEDE